MFADVSVVIPTYNRQVYLKEAVESCFAGNESIEVEAIVVDDGSTDGTRNYLDSLDDERVRTFLQRHRGGQVARNKGLSEARGWAIKFLDDDDYLVPGALAAEYRLLRESKAQVCYGSVEKYFEEEDAVLGQFSNVEHDQLLVGLLHGEVSRLPLTFTFVRSALDGVQWDESLDYQQDWAFALEAASYGLSCIQLDAPVAVHRIHRDARISDNRASDTPAFRINQMAEMFWQAYQRAASREAPTVALRCAAAAGLWEQAHKLAPFDFEGFESWYGKVRRIAPCFQPPRDHALLQWMDRLTSPVVTERLINPIRKIRIQSS